METYDWYQQLIKPVWAPPAWLFGPVWTVLYVLIAVSFGYTAYLYVKKKISLGVFCNNTSADHYSYELEGEIVH